MILVDSSAFIEYYRPSGDPVASAAVAEAISRDAVAVNGIIQVEVTAFASREADRRRLVADMRAYHWLDLGPRDFELAAEVGFELRREGITIPPTDLIIAASAIGSGATLYHLDRHFDRLALHTDLNVKHLGTEQ